MSRPAFHRKSTPKIIPYQYLRSNTSAFYSLILQLFSNSSNHVLYNATFCATVRVPAIVFMEDFLSSMVGMVTLGRHDLCIIVFVDMLSNSTLNIYLLRRVHLVSGTTTEISARALSSSLAILGIIIKY